MSRTPLTSTTESAPDAPAADAADAPSATESASASACCDDPAHDHGDGHGPTGADIVGSLTKGFAILSLVVPVLGVVLLGVALTRTPTNPAVLLLGLALGGLQLAVLVATSLVVGRLGGRLALSPGPLAVRSVLEELLRLAVVLLALVLWPADPRAPLGLWIGAGCALVWIVLTAAQLVSARRRIVRPSPWAQELVGTLLQEKVGVPRTMLMRLLDVIGLILFQVGASILITTAPLMTVATIVLSVGTGLSTIVLQRRPPAERVTSPWAFAPFGIGLLTLALAVIGALST